VSKGKRVKTVIAPQEGAETPFKDAYQLLRPSKKIKDAGKESL
jgi:hypothetical protein